MVTLLAEAADTLSFSDFGVVGLAMWILWDTLKRTLSERKSNGESRRLEARMVDLLAESNRRIAVLETELIESNKRMMKFEVLYEQNIKLQEKFSDLLERQLAFAQKTADDIKRVERDVHQIQSDVHDMKSDIKLRNFSQGSGAYPSISPDAKPRRTNDAK